MSIAENAKCRPREEIAIPRFCVEGRKAAQPVVNALQPEFLLQAIKEPLTTTKSGPKGAAVNSI